MRLPTPPRAIPMNRDERQHVIAELDRLLAEIAHLLQRFEIHGQQSNLKSDYLALHELQAKALEQRQAHAQALPGSPERPPEASAPPGLCH